MHKTFKVLGVLVFFGIISGFIFIYSGLFNVATAWEDPAFVRWALATTRERAVARRAASIEVPPLNRPEQVEEGFRSYWEMCAICHTPPGASDSPTAQGLNPPPPDLAKHAAHLSEAELFWSIKNGIRMTGMPAWGPTHDDAELWNIVAFVKTLPNVSESDYRALDEKTEKGHGHSGDRHGNGHGQGGHMDSLNKAGQAGKPHEETKVHQDDGHAH